LLYKKNVWIDAKVINFIAQGCFSKYYKVKLAACYFLIETTEAKPEESSGEESGDEQAPRESKITKRRKAKDRQLKREKKKHIKRQNRGIKENIQKNFFPID